MQNSDWGVFLFMNLLIEEMGTFSQAGIVSNLVSMGGVSMA